MKKHAKSLLILVVPTMAFGWLASAAFIHILFPKLNFVSSLVISACLTPTDPIISAAVIGGDWAMKNVADSIRYILLAESAANDDGLAYPFLSISIYLTTESSRAVAFEKGGRHWLDMCVVVIEGDETGTTHTSDFLGPANVVLLPPKSKIKKVICIPSYLKIYKKGEIVIVEIQE